MKLEKNQKEFKKLLARANNRSKMRYQKFLSFIEYDSEATQNRKLKKAIDDLENAQYDINDVIETEEIDSLIN